MAQTRLLKKDLFGEVRHLPGENGGTIVRDASKAKPWLRWLARALLRREANILAALDGLSGVPQLVAHSPKKLERTFIRGAPMHEARPRDPAYFRRAAKALRKLHRAGIVHNDLAKEPNILVAEGQQPAFIDFQLAALCSERGRLFRALAYDDVRHLLKHKRTYCPDSLTQREKRILASPSIPARIWMKTGKRVYLFITRRLLGWADREGAADRGRQN
ncbi:MAG: serine/threonine protein kinase [Gammaproteobacteria bacterium]|nr:serine/threonine protein kinase [Gammaproteobacteria bacterium]